MAAHGARATGGDAGGRIPQHPLAGRIRGELLLHGGRSPEVVRGPSRLVRLGQEDAEPEADGCHGPTPRQVLRRVGQVVLGNRQRAGVRLLGLVRPPEQLVDPADAEVRLLNGFAHLRDVGVLRGRVVNLERVPARIG